MHFQIKNTLKNNHNHIYKYPLSYLQAKKQRISRRNEASSKDDFQTKHKNKFSSNKGDKKIKNKK